MKGLHIKLTNLPETATINEYKEQIPKKHELSKKDQKTVLKWIEIRSREIDSLTGQLENSLLLLELAISYGYTEVKLLRDLFFECNVLVYELEDYKLKFQDYENMSLNSQISLLFKHDLSLKNPLHSEIIQTSSDRIQKLYLESLDSQNTSEIEEILINCLKTCNNSKLENYILMWNNLEKKIKKNQKTKVPLIYYTNISEKQIKLEQSISESEEKKKNQIENENKEKIQESIKNENNKDIVPKKENKLDPELISNLTNSQKFGEAFLKLKESYNLNPFFNTTENLSFLLKYYLTENAKNLSQNNENKEDKKISENCLEALDTLNSSFLGKK